MRSNKLLRKEKLLAALPIMNFKHINNASTKAAVRRIIEGMGYQCSELCSPEEFVEEIRKYRAEHAARYGNDLKKICEALRRQEKTSQKEFVRFGPNLLQSKQGSR